MYAYISSLSKRGLKVSRLKREKEKKEAFISLTSGRESKEAADGDKKRAFNEFGSCVISLLSFLSVRIKAQTQPQLVPI